MSLVSSPIIPGDDHPFPLLTPDPNISHIDWLPSSTPSIWGCHHQQSKFVELSGSLHCQWSVLGCCYQALGLHGRYPTHQELLDGPRKPERKLVDNLLEGMDVPEGFHMPRWDEILADRDSL